MIAFLFLLFLGSVYSNSSILNTTDLDVAEEWIQAKITKEWFEMVKQSMDFRVSCSSYEQYIIPLASISDLAAEKKCDAQWICSDILEELIRKRQVSTEQRQESLVESYRRTSTLYFLFQYYEKHVQQPLALLEAENEKLATQCSILQECSGMCTRLKLPAIKRREL